MGSKLTLTIKDYHNGGGDLTIEINGAIVSEKRVGGVDVIKLKVVRKPDKNSTRLGMFAYIRNNKPGYQSLGFSEMVLIFDRFGGASQFLSRTITVFSDVAVDSLMRRGDDEEITFIVGKKSEDFSISAVVGTP